MSTPDSAGREAELLAALADRDAVIAVLRAEIEALKRQVGMDSSNSSMPPGSDGPKARARRAKQRTGKPSPRRRGGQAGHDGSGLARVPVPDLVEVVAPTDCGGCGQSLAGVPGRVTSRIQMFDTPPVKLQVTEYRMTAVTCPGCSSVTRAPAPDGLAGPCCYGPNVRAATALLACNGHMSIERAADLVGVLLDAPVSTGFTGGLIKRVAATLSGFETALKDRPRNAAVMHHDETPARVAGDDADRLLYIYTARADKLVWFGAADNRGHTALDGFAILPGFHGTLVRDDYAGYAKYDKHLTAVQLCCAHLLRYIHAPDRVTERRWPHPICRPWPTAASSPHGDAFSTWYIWPRPATPRDPQHFVPCPADGHALGACRFQHLSGDLHPPNSARSARNASTSGPRPVPSRPSSCSCGNLLWVDRRSKVGADRRILTRVGGIS